MPELSLRNLPHRRIWIALGLALIAAIWVLSLIPAPPQVGLDHEDKMEHFLAYGTLMLWWAQISGRTRDRFIMAIAFVVMGVVIEFVQDFTAWRTYEVNDMIANSIGVAIGWVIACTPAGSLLTRLKNLRTSSGTGIN